MRINFKYHLDFIRGLHGHLHAKTSTIIPLLCQRLGALEKSLSKSRSKERALAVQVLSDLSWEIEKAGLENTDTELLHHRIDQVQESILQTNASKLKSPIPAKLAVILGSDHNTALMLMVHHNLYERVPFIVSYSILCCSDLEKEEDQTKFRDIFQHYFQRPIFTNAVPDWQIYLQVDQTYGDQFLICLPKEIQLEDLDLKPPEESGTKLVPITYEEVLKGPHDPYQFEALEPLLSGPATHDKLFSIHAHGSIGQLLSLNQNQIHLIMSLLENQRCRAADFGTCYAGGQSTLQLLSQDSEMPAPSFPLIVRSIGDYSTYSGQIDDRLAPFFKELETVMRQHAGETGAAFRKAIMKFENESVKRPVNQIQVYFPQGKQARQGFRSINESATSASVTIHTLRKAQVAKSPLSFNHIAHLTIYPTAIDAKIAITGPSPALLSTIPGQARHAIQEIEMKESTFLEFMNAQFAFYENEVGVNKAFFIEKMVCKDGVYEKVIVLCEEKRAPRILYQRNGRHYLAVEKKKPITPFKWAVETSRAYRITKPASEALRLATAGQQSVEDTAARWITHPFQGMDEPCNLDSLPQLSEPKARTLFRQLSSASRAHFLFHLATNGRVDLAEKLIKSSDIPFDTVLPSGDTLLHIAIRVGSTAMFDVLMSQKIDINAQGASGNTPLHLALGMKNVDFAKELLASKEIDTTKKNNKKFSAVTYGYFLPNIWNLLMARATPADVSSVLSIYSRQSQPPQSSIEAILQLGGDPTVGTPSALVTAFKNGDLDLIATLLKYGATPFQRNAEGHFPFIEILKTSPRSTLIHWMNLPDTRALFHPTPEELREFLEAAKARDDASIIQSLLEMNDPSTMSADIFMVLLLHFESELCMRAIRQGFDLMQKNKEGEPIIELALNGFLTKEHVIEIIQTIPMDWNQTTSDGRKLYTFPMIRNAKEAGLLLLEKGVRVPEEDLSKLLPTINFIGDLDLLRRFVEIHGPLMPAFILELTKNNFTHFESVGTLHSFNRLMSVLDNGFIDPLTDLGEGKNLIETLLDGLVGHRRFILPPNSKHMTNIVKHLLKAGGDPNYRRISSGDSRPKTLIEMALRDHNQPLVDLLIRSGLSKENLSNALEAVKDSQETLDWVEQHQFTL